MFFDVCSPIVFRVMLRFWQCFLVGMMTALYRSSSKNFLNPHVVNLSVCLFNIFFLSITSVKIAKYLEKFVIFLNYIGFFYINFLIVWFLDLFTKHFKIYNILIFSVHFEWLELSQNFGMLLNYKPLTYIPKLVIVSKIYIFAEHFKNLNTFIVLF